MTTPPTTTHHLTGEKGHRGRRQRGRLRGRRRLRKQPKQQDRPEALLARHLLRTEFALRDGRRPRREESFWEELAKELNRLMDRITGRRRSAGGGPVAAPGGPDHGTPVAVGQGGPDGAPAAGPGRPVPFEEAVRHGREQFQEMIGRLTAAERRVFEDAVLDLVRGDRKYRKAFESSRRACRSSRATRWTRT